MQTGSGLEVRQGLLKGPLGKGFRLIYTPCSWVLWVHLTGLLVASLPGGTGWCLLMNMILQDNLLACQANLTEWASCMGRQQASTRVCVSLCRCGCQRVQAALHATHRGPIAIAHAIGLGAPCPRVTGISSNGNDRRKQVGRAHDLDC